MTDMKDPNHKPTEGTKVSVPVAIGAALIGSAAAAAGLINPVVAIIAGGAAPVVTEMVQRLLRDRATRLKQTLDKEGVDLETLITEHGEMTPIQADLLRETIEIVLRTDSQEKVTLITRLLRLGLEAATDSDAMAAKRFARTVGRLDELEFRIALGLRRKGRDFKLSDVQNATRIDNPDLVRTGLSILVSEGIVRQIGTDLESWALTDFGYRFLAELTAAYGDNESLGKE